MRTLQRQPARLSGYLPLDPAVGVPVSIVTSPDRRVLASVGANGDIGLVELATGTRLPAPAVGAVGSRVSFSPDSAWLVVQTSDSLVLWDIAGGRVAQTIPLPSGDPFGATVSADHRMAAVVAAGAVQLLPVPSGSGPPGTIALPDGFTAFRIALSPDHQLVAVTGVPTFSDTTSVVLVFETASGRAGRAAPGRAWPVHLRGTSGCARAAVRRRRRRRRDADLGPVRLARPVVDPLAGRFLGADPCDRGPARGRRRTRDRRGGRPRPGSARHQRGARRNRTGPRRRNR